MKEGVPQSKKNHPESNFYVEPNPEESFELSGEIIEQALTSAKFTETLQKAIKMVLKHHREIGFAIIKEAEKKVFHYSNPIGGGNEEETHIGVSLLEIGKKLENRGLRENFDWFSFGDFHFHGYEIKTKHKTIIPSTDDIGGSSPDVHHIPQLNIIANYFSNTGIVEALVYHPISMTLFKKLNTDIFQDYIQTSIDELCDSNPSQEEVISALRSIGFKACMVTFKNGQLTEESIASIRSLGIKPKN